ncbi:hypothetical protein WMF27_14870 [Sorangium sp. So ce281]
MRARQHRSPYMRAMEMSSRPALPGARRIGSPSTAADGGAILNA